MEALDRRMICPRYLFIIGASISTSVVLYISTSTNSRAAGLLGLNATGSGSFWTPRFLCTRMN